MDARVALQIATRDLIERAEEKNIESVLLVSKQHATRELLSSLAFALSELPNAEVPEGKTLDVPRSWEEVQSLAELMCQAVPETYDVPKSYLPILDAFVMSVVSRAKSLEPTYVQPAPIL